MAACTCSPPACSRLRERQELVYFQHPHSRCVFVKKDLLCLSSVCEVCVCVCVCERSEASEGVWRSEMCAGETRGKGESVERATRRVERVETDERIRDDTDELAVSISTTRTLKTMQGSLAFQHPTRPECAPTAGSAGRTAPPARNTARSGHPHEWQGYPSAPALLPDGRSCAPT